MAPCNGQQWHHVHSTKVGCQPPLPPPYHTTMAPGNRTTSTPPKLAVTLLPKHSTLHSTLQWHLGTVPRPLHPAMAPWCHVQLPKWFVALPPFGSKNPYSYRYLGNKALPQVHCSFTLGSFLNIFWLTFFSWYGRCFYLPLGKDVSFADTKRERQ